MKLITQKFVGEVWATDIAVLPESHDGKRYLLVLMKYLSKWVVAVPLTSFETSSIVQVLLYEVVLKFSLPTRLISDNGTNYISEAMSVVCTRLGISRSLTSVEHPQSDGLVERMNRTLKTSLSIVVGNDMRTWAQHLPFVVFAYSTAKQSSTKFSPFEVMFGRKAAVLPILPSQEVVNPKTYAAQQWNEFLNEEIPVIHSKALENIKKAQEQQRNKQYDKKTRSLSRSKVGQLVLRKNHKMMSFPKERWTGP